jgi:hypothetical protein
LQRKASAGSSLPCGNEVDLAVLAPGTECNKKTPAAASASTPSWLKLSGRLLAVNSQHSQFN